MLKPYHYLTLIGLVLSGCDQEQDKGGDHVPELKTYTVSAVDEAAQSAGLSATEIESAYLRPFIHLSETYRVCLREEDVSEENLSAHQKNLIKSTGSMDSYGLEGILNYTLATIKKYASEREGFSSKTQIQLLWAKAKTCDFLISKAKATEFPFTDDDFKDDTKVTLYKNQLRDPSGKTNAIPVAYLLDTTSAEQEFIDLQFLIAQLIGLASSSEDGSYLNAGTTASDENLGWHLLKEDKSISLGNDSLILYNFALVYQDILKPSDLETFHHFQDELDPINKESDKELEMPASVTNTEFAEVLGNKYIRGARLVGANVKVCVQDLSSETVSDANVSAYFAFLDVSTDGGLSSFLYELNNDYSPNLQIVTTGCNLIVSFRTGKQFPFKTKPLNGLYAHEGSIKDSAGDLTSIPVIYLNAQNLNLDPDDAGTDKKYVGLVLEHEFAHFLGLRHSTADDSILSPAGYHDAWDATGGDSKIFAAFISEWSAHQ